uniref:Uncharacterized protein n=1 Tax=Strigamia maritima TaxID=126957 RepID=T1INC5_STRMM
MYCNNKSYRKAFFTLLIFLIIFFYLGPWFLRYTFNTATTFQIDPLERCLNNHLNVFLSDERNFDAYITKLDTKNGFLPYIGNGLIGFAVDADPALFVTSRRVLSTHVPFRPAVFVEVDGAGESASAVVMHYTSGVVHKFECVSKRRSSIDISISYYAHRILPSIYVQDIKIINPLGEDIDVDLSQSGAKYWPDATVAVHELHVNNIVQKVDLIYGTVKMQRENMAFSIAQTKVPKSLSVKAQSSNSLHIVTSVHFVEGNSNERVKEELTMAATMDLERALGVNYRKFREDHVKVWNQLWSPGVSISYSKAIDALNGDKINATLYYLLSNSRTLLAEVDLEEARRSQLIAQFNDPDKCYAGHHTLQASKLWSDLNTLDEILRVTSMWKLTLEKQGCHTMMQAGADGVLQAALLSFGAFKFSGHHLEFGMQPKDLHRDYLFRRISYGNSTHLNISVVVGEDNKAALYAVLDRSDRNYYACDGGCLDPPIQLSQEKVVLPVKRTDPPTAVLYITSNKQHMIELKDAIHFHEIVEAPAHEHHVIALHRHGHHFGGLPTIFWVSISFLVAVFHLFLFKLIYNEYCAYQGRYRM